MIGYFDEEQRLHIVDRKKDMMKYCGSQMSPTEIEQYIVKNPRVKAVCVVSVPDEVAGDLPAAVIVQNDNDDPISKEEIEQMVAGKNYFDLLLIFYGTCLTKHVFQITLLTTNVCVEVFILCKHYHLHHPEKFCAALLERW